MYREVLGPGLHLTPALHGPSQASLEDGHRAFADAVLSAAAVSAGGSVLQIGGGWGGLAREGIAKHGCRCVTTPSLPPSSPPVSFIMVSLQKWTCEPFGATHCTMLKCVCL